MIIKKYNYLPKDALQIRLDVFVKEQGFEEEFDAVDDIAVHLLAFDDLSPIAVCRFYWNKEKDSYVIGRIAVVREYRGKEIGAKILREAEKHICEMGGKKVFLAAQVKAAGFYEKQGYSTVGKQYYEEYCPHIWMCKNVERCTER